MFKRIGLVMALLAVLLFSGAAIPVVEREVLSTSYSISQVEAACPAGKKGDACRAAEKKAAAEKAAKEKAAKEAAAKAAATKAAAEKAAKEKAAKEAAAKLAAAKVAAQQKIDRFVGCVKSNMAVLPAAVKQSPKWYQESKKFLDALNFALKQVQVADPYSVSAKTIAQVLVTVAKTGGYYIPWYGTIVAKCI